jgi:hypothetical protein
MHAIPIPVAIFFLTNMLFVGNYGGVFVLTYITIAGSIYFNDNSKYFSKRGFLYALSFVGFWMVLYLFMILLAAFA